MHLETACVLETVRETVDEKKERHLQIQCGS
jgi:hypothetical protein